MTLRRGAQGWRVAVSTQTPLLRLLARRRSGRSDASLRLDALEGGPDATRTTGGVTRMLHPLLRAWLADGVASQVEWVAMGGPGPLPRVADGSLSLSFVPFPARHRAGYARVKERLWSLLNADPRDPPAPADPLRADAWGAFERYQVDCARALARGADRMGGVDLLYVHDFQQIGVGAAWSGPATRKVFHLHTPFPATLPPGWRRYLLDRLAVYDAVVVSTPRTARNLQAAGLRRARVEVIPPFIDPGSYPPATPEGAAAFRVAHGIAPDAPLVLHVGRMDPVKGQDRLVQALPALLRRVPGAHVALVGNGSFSSSPGGLALSKGRAWRGRLERLVRDLGVAHRVAFTGHLPEPALQAAYAAADLFCLPSRREGFGLAAIEAWRHARPLVVDARAGVSDLVEPGVDGLVVDASDPDALAEALARVLDDPGLARRLGRAGRERSEEATLHRGRVALESLVARARRAYAAP